MAQLSDSQKALLSEAAPLIRKHLWQGTSPPPPPHPKQPPWHMGRCLSIWKRLVFAGWPPEHINGAIAVVRSVAPWMAGPLRMTVFYHRHATPLLEQCVARYLEGERVERKKRSRSPGRIAINIQVSHGD